MKDPSPTGEPFGGRKNMVHARPKALVVRGRRLDAAALASALEAGYEVVAVDPEQVEQALATGEFAMVIASPGHMRVIESETVSAQTSALLDALGEAVCLFESPARLVWANRVFLALDGVTRDKTLDACKRVAQRIDETALSAQPPSARVPTQRLQVATEDGRTYEAIISPVDPAPSGADGGGRPIGPAQVAVALRDVTDMHRTQQKIDALDRAGAELVRLEAEQVRQMHVHDRLEFLRKKIVTLAHDLLQFDHFAIWLIEPESQRLEPVITTGLAEGVQNIRLHAAREGSGISGFVAATGRSYICHDASKDIRYIRGLDTPGSSLTTPLMLNDRVIGVFNVESAKTGAFSEDDRHFAEIFSRYVAMALHMLNLLVSERIATSETTTGRMADVLQEPLNDLAVEAEWLRDQAAADPGMLRHVDRIQRDIEAMRRRISDVARGPRTILGVEKELEESREDPLLSGRRVLVADDDIEIRDLIRDVLKKRGAMVSTARTGAEAIREIEHATASKDDTGPRQGFALVVSDIKMPDRNGYEVFSAARHRDATLPVILMTGFGYDPHHSIVRASQEGLQCVLFKPFQIEKLIEEVHKALMGPTPPGA